MSTKPLDYENLNENVKKCQYAVRGELYLRASELQKEGKKVRIFTLFMSCYRHFIAFNSLFRSIDLSNGLPFVVLGFHERNSIYIKN